MDGPLCEICVGKSGMQGKRQHGPLHCSCLVVHPNLKYTYHRYALDPRAPLLTAGSPGGR